jgi:hypothetical protein
LNGRSPAHYLLIALGLTLIFPWAVWSISRTAFYALGFAVKLADTIGFGGAPGPRRQRSR